ncbi:nucleoside-diphosphate sugar epimerase [Primorskyibacter flagellatus]|uniref:Nucleoside-diphosphate sugar epimerase n=1 Tax=Primorskyibacter flagellatus TaxID=1387277 RepID=A0A917EFV4_9RHOB|nr:nucleoside-diphosphate sugar epimerase/dehydratase [Primorskyibacter flagellatus]GGE37808.1 nucleoside-diphosphate sugar epimerase [Primorskyibacter flagellatus]
MMSLLHRISDLSRHNKIFVQILSDCLFISLCFFMAMALRLDGFYFTEDATIWLPMLVVFPVTIVSFVRLGLYRAIVRYITSEALGAVAIGVVVSSITLAAASAMFDVSVPRSVPGIYAILLLFTVGGSRFIVRSVFRRSMKSSRKPVIVYGAGDAGRQLVNALTHSKDYRPVAFVDDDERLHQTSIAGFRIYASDKVPNLIVRTGARAILLALPSASRARRREIVQALSPHKIEIKTIPGVEDIVNGKAKFSDIRTVTPEDLLGRDPVPPRPELMRRNISGKVVLVTGAGGSIGSELCRQLIEYAPKALVLYELSEFALYSVEADLREIAARTGMKIDIFPVLGSVQNPERTRAVLRSFEVQTVYHAAAYKHVPLVEENVVEGVRNNVFGTLNLARLAIETGVEQFILISTDKAVRPTNFMGASKRMAELICQALAADQDRTAFSMVRFGNVLGSSGSVIPKFQAQIDQGGPVTVTHREINRYFMTIPEAAQLVIQAGAMGKGGDVFVLDMGEPIKILDLALSMIRLHGLTPYVVDSMEEVDKTRGDIAICITGLRKGEKLYEELLIGDNSSGTDHPRIMTASEVFLPFDRLNGLLDRLAGACKAFDVQAIRNIFLEAPLAYAPNGDVIADLMWAERRAAVLPVDPKPLRVVEMAQGKKRS